MALSVDYQILELVDGVDLTDFLGVLKWEPPIPTELAGKVEGLFPSFIPKTDQERCQNIFADLKESHYSGPWVIEEKMDGCLRDSVMISTNKGNVSIAEIVADPKNYKVKSYDVDEEKIVFDSIVNVMKKPNDGKQWFRLTLEDDREIEITGNHKVYLPELKCWRKVENLCEGDVFLIE